ncbi:MAG: hypothetical protein K0R65_2573 [Crocinitomicaceae bacterium]|nr:hypothetical protein [Crocinitomicaceae bacterium]
MRKTAFILPFILLSCFGEQARKNIQAENLVLNECDHVIGVLNKRLKQPVPDSLYVSTCGCISGILRDDLVSGYDIHSLETNPARLKEILSLELTNKFDRIRKECLGNRN